MTIFKETRKWEEEGKRAKYLVAFRHSLRDGEGNLSPEGVRLAKLQGQIRSYLPIKKFFVGPMPRSGQTRDAFLLGHGGQGVEIIGEPVVDIGNNELFNAIGNKAFDAAVKGGASYFDALFVAHDRDFINELIAKVRKSVEFMLSQINYGEMVAYVGHSPLIELVAYSTFIMFIDFQKMPAFLRDMERMGGIEFLVEDSGTLLFQRYLPAPPQ